MPAERPLDASHPSPPHARERAQANRTRYSGDAGGHYESFFARANHPSRPLAFWLRYTLFIPKRQPAQALGELWGTYFDGEAERIVGLRQAHPLDRCRFDSPPLNVAVASACLQSDALDGEVRGSTGSSLRWKLSYRGGDAPLYLLPRAMYDGSFPKAKALVPAPGCLFDGSLWVGDGDGEPREVRVEGWRGSQNHNWGQRHTDAYAWVQCAGFDGAPDSFLECAIARIKLGPVWTPAITVLTLRLEDHEYRFDNLWAAVRQPGRYTFGTGHDRFTLLAERTQGDVRVRVRCEAPRTRFVALTYLNPPGGQRICLNTKLARCEVELTRDGYAPRTLHSRHGAAFEILADDPCGLPLRV